MNASAPKEEWGLNLNNEPVGPFVKVLVLRLLDRQTMDRYAFVTSSIGGSIALGDLSDKTKIIRRIKGANVTAVVSCQSALMKSSFNPRGVPRPDFRVVEWIALAAPPESIGVTTPTPPTSLPPAKAPPTAPEAPPAPAVAAPAAAATPAAATPRCRCPSGACRGVYPCRGGCSGRGGYSGRGPRHVRGSPGCSDQDGRRRRGRGGRAAADRPRRAERRDYFLTISNRRNVMSTMSHREIEIWVEASHRKIDRLENQVCGLRDRTLRRPQGVSRKLRAAGRRPRRPP